MARVCPTCRRLTGDDESLCESCGTTTVSPELWQAMRSHAVQPRPVPTPSPPAPTKQTPEQVEHWAQLGMGGIAAFFVFFVVFLVAYMLYSF